MPKIIKMNELELRVSTQFSKAMLTQVKQSVE